ncbi:MAG: hypothetical protein J6X16_00195 [Bacteroidales bacterium]|nr:hypothetical protein [Bacteroidales bacterium]
MKKILLSLCCVVLMITSLVSCKPDVELTSDYQDVTVVYGLLNPLDQYQYIKIYKGYLTKENALVWAQDLDNISYYNDIIVKLEEYFPAAAGGELRYTYVLDTVMSIPKNYGVFASPTQVLYRMKKSIREGYRYRLVIENKATGRVVTSETTTIANMAFNIPLGTSHSISTINLNKDDPWSVGFKTGSWPENAYAVDAYVTFRYIEKDKVTGDTVHKAVRDICVTPGFTPGNETSFKPNVIYRILQENIEVNDDVWRFPDTYECVDIKLWACDQVYYTYYKTAQPSSSIVQDRINYTNIEADDNMALGFFASRSYYKRTFRLDVINHNEDSLAHGQWTKNLNFRPYTELLDE